MIIFFYIQETFYQIPGKSMKNTSSMNFNIDLIRELEISFNTLVEIHANLKSAALLFQRLRVIFSVE